MIDYKIKTLQTKLDKEIKYKIDHKTKPLGSLGQLEKIGFQICRIQQTLSPALSKPTIVLVGSDHDICEEGVSPNPQEITWQQMLNFSKGGGGIGLFTSFYKLNLKVVDAGVNYDFNGNKNIINAKIKNGSGNFLKGPAMTPEECKQAMLNGGKIVKQLNDEGCNVVGFGEMGIGNTSPASVIMSLICKIPLTKCVGIGAGLDEKGVSKKYKVLQQAINNAPKLENGFDILAYFGGIEIATIAGGMLKAAELGMLILNDGFIITSALIAAQAINPNVLEYVIHSHQSKEGGHPFMMEYLKAEPILSLDLRLGEGSGAAIAYPIIEGAVKMVNDMTSFDSGEITDTTDTGKSVL